MIEKQLPQLATQIADVVRIIIAEIRPRLVSAALSGQQGEQENIRPADNFLSKHDVWMHGRYRELLQEILPAFWYTSDEGDPERIGNSADPDLLVLVDPLDTSELAVRGIHGYTHIMVYSRAISRPIVAIVADLFHEIQLVGLLACTGGFPSAGDGGACVPGGGSGGERSERCVRDVRSTN